MGILDSLKRAEEVKPLYEQNGVKVVSFEDQRAVAQAEIINDVDLGNRTVNPDGTVARSRTKYAAINVDHLYLNRYKQVGKKLFVVTDYRAIKEQPTGRIYSSQIKAFVFVRENDVLKKEKMTVISDKDFVSDYTKTLNPEAMAQLIPLMAGENDISADALPI